ncbi:GntR family transcriptional regulator [Rhizobium etli]|uniref:GntR family transcriptional regulator n=1 Tax=Rhizobium etli TaxID=29449 RepID=UPI000383A60C|nr:GntR family transcriptional regulator [Rhizobium etli]AGS25211.1 GntR family transcriptional regulator protein [Rhizobium etli bv. mimosae str. Mim1]
MSTEDTIANRISRVLAERIITGVLEPGSKLRQDHIAEEFGTSHVPVREAFRRLEAQGLAVSQARRGVRVASFSLVEVQEVALMRSVLEGLALRHAAPHLTPYLLDEAKAVADECDNAKDIHQWDEANRRFHRLLITPCGLPRLLTAIEDLHVAGSRFLFATSRAAWAPRVDADHKAILDNLRNGRIDQAVIILERHVKRVSHRPLPHVSGTRATAFSIEG